MSANESNAETKEAKELEFDIEEVSTSEAQCSF